MRIGKGDCKIGLQKLIGDDCEVDEDKDEVEDEEKEEIEDEEREFEEKKKKGAL